jgi:hypothetical protein
LLPHLNPCRSLARAAVWSVAHCRTNDPSAAIDDLVATSRLGQNASPVLIGHLVDLLIQGMVIDSVTEHASTLANTGDGRLTELFNAANYNEGLGHAIEQEADMIARETDRLATLPPEEIMRKLKTIENDPSRFESMEPTQAIAEVRQAVELQRQYAKALELTETDYREWQTGLEAVRKTNPFAQYLLSPIEGVINQTQAMTVKSAMAAAGLAVMKDGPNVLQSHPDPTTSQPFAYKKTADGFELESSFQVEEKSLKLSFK